MRRASAPELADLSSIYGTTQEPYAIGNMIRFQILETSGRSRTIQARIVKSFAPFTMACVVVVRIKDSTAELKGDFVLKIYDRRYSNNIRRKAEDQWNQVRDMEFEKRRWSKDFVKYFLQLMNNEHLHYAGEEDEACKNANQNFNELELDAYDELYFQVHSLKMYRTELEVYRRARSHHIDGLDVPRFISSVRIPPVYNSKHCNPTSTSIKGTPGILLQYIPGFPMTDLYNTPFPLAPLTTWPSIINDGLRIVQYYTQHMSMRNLDDCIPRNNVVHWDPISSAWKCKLIDFGHCMFRGADERRWDWRYGQALTDDEGAIARWMAIELERKKGFVYEWERSGYSQQLIGDFMGEDGSCVEPVGYSP